MSIHVVRRLKQKSLYIESLCIKCMHNSALYGDELYHRLYCLGVVSCTVSIMKDSQIITITFFYGLVYIWVLHSAMNNRYMCGCLYYFAQAIWQ